MIRLFVFLLTIGLALTSSAQNLQLAVVKYKGGGDWYANPTSLPNLVQFCNQELSMSLEEEVATVEIGDTDLFNYPFVHLTGHGNVDFSTAEAENLRTYLLAGGFLHIDDNYGLDEFIRPQMKKAFPELEFVELPFDHPIYQQPYVFPQGLPKIHEHDMKPPQGFALINEGRMICFYSFESDLGDGWEDPEVHGDSESTRLKALKMGANIVQFAFTQE